MIPICEVLNCNPLVRDFKFIALTQQSQIRAKMGFSDDNISYPYVYCAYIDRENFDRALLMTEEADIAIIGEAPDEFIYVRMKKNKLTFLSSERFYKLGLCRYFVPSSYRKKKDRFLQFSDKELYYLTIGAYLPYELQLLRFPIEKCFQWAYFPQIMKQQMAERDYEKSCLKILWAGRMIRYKHPELAIRIADKLKKAKINFSIEMIGEGPIMPKVINLIKKLNLSENIKVIGNCLPEVVQKRMAESDIFLFTSDFWEGWGAVLNESMAQGCIPVASYKAGASEILIENGQNGYTYRTLEEAVEAINRIYMNPALQELLSARARKTVEINWAPQVAADRFVYISECLLNGKSVPQYEEFEPMGKVTIRKARNYFTANF